MLDHKGNRAVLSRNNLESAIEIVERIRHRNTRYATIAMLQGDKAKMDTYNDTVLECFSGEINAMIQLIKINHCGI